ncbi:hypothetical protein SynA15127_02834 [Synechococcus sp. A15-127]|uniref:hypothetical protein n=1 Tax=Synechococcus sp. A15-127 TaxID=1050624 RepID=UPI001647A086|nr:hypothetical protein [Synechococcus sp. A15-127]QNI95889.1 hypothetical protein SynA15127_02834 [Synechococcus sp. A15-127]
MTDQWTLNRLNFAGDWQGPGAWFGRDAAGRLDLASPNRVIDPTRYRISFPDDDNGRWDGSGLMFAKGGHASYAISRASYNAGGGCWQFQGAGGQSSLSLDQQRPRFGHEINLFSGRSRSMLVLLWEWTDSHWCLHMVGAVAFRCRQSMEIEQVRPVPDSAEALLEPLRGWRGTAEQLRPQQGTGGRVRLLGSTTFAPEQLLRSSCSAVMPDGLVFSVPEELPGGAFQLEIGGLLSAELFQQISIEVDADGRLITWERRRFQNSLGRSS